MTDIYRYNDVTHYRVSQRSVVRSNLCSLYFVKKQRFCGNYCTRYNFEVSRYHRRCWRHIRRRGAGLPPVILLMIVCDQIYNKTRWLKFMDECEQNNVPIELVVYEKHMFKCTVRHPWNFISRFRPIPELYNTVQRTYSLRDSHGGTNYATAYTDMLAYGSTIPHAICCIVITERTVPIRSPLEIYKRATTIVPKCALNPSYNVSFHTHCPPSSLPKLGRGKPFQLVNNKAQALYSTHFIKEALPTLRTYYKYFGLQYSNTQGYSIKDHRLYTQWQQCTGAMLDEFWLLNSYLLHLWYKKNSQRPIGELKTKYMDNGLPENDNIIVAEIHEYRDNVIRSTLFKDVFTIKKIRSLNKSYHSLMRYYNALGILHRGGMKVNLAHVLSFLRAHKKNALFFRSVEML